MARSLFFKKLKCFHCGGGMKAKTEKKRRVYICTNYDLRNGKCEVRTIMPEQTIIDVVNKRFNDRKKITLSDEEVSEQLIEMIIEERLLFRIKLKDFPNDDIVYGRNHINY